MLSAQEIQDLEFKANKIRQDIIEMLIEAKSGHSAGPLDMADIFTALYFHTLNHNPTDPNWEERDRVILSNGHICPVLYAAMAESGYFPVDELKTLRKFGSRLQGHPHREKLPGLETSSGPLGSGLSQAAGMAYWFKKEGKKNWVYCLMGDGEQDCGQIWEALMFAGKNKLSNLIGIIDRNNIQIDGFTEDVMPLEPLRLKYESFNWEVIEVDGHNIQAVIETFERAKEIENKPVMIIANTIAGKGVDFMEYKFEWHGIVPDGQDVPGAPPKGEQAKMALEELRTLGGKIKSEHQ